MIEAKQERKDPILGKFGSLHSYMVVAGYNGMVISIGLFIPHRVLPEQLAGEFCQILLAIFPTIHV